MSYLIVILFVIAAAQFFLYWRLEQKVGEAEEIGEQIAEEIKGQFNSLQ